jgi:uncharacterized repeat protein (TIGR02543 family)
MSGSTWTGSVRDTLVLPAPTFTAPSGKIISTRAWNTAADGSGTSYAAGDTLTLGTTNVVLYANWVSATAKTVTFNTNYPVGTSVDSRTQSANTSTALRSNTFALPGYAFQGWGTTSSTTTVRYTNGAAYAFTADLSLYAIWQATSISLSVRSDAVVTMTTRTATVGGTLFNGQDLGNGDVNSVYLCSANGVLTGNTLTGNVRCSQNEWTSSSSLAAGSSVSYSEIAGSLSPNTTYYEQIQVNFANGTSVSSTARAFTTLAAPVATTLQPDKVASTQAVIKGEVDPQLNKLTRVYFCWGTDLATVDACSKTSDIVQSVWWNGGTSGNQQFTLTLDNLKPGTQYFYKVLTSAEDNNGLGTMAYRPHRSAAVAGSTISFTTPSATTGSPATSITGNSASVSGTVLGGTNGLANADVTSAKFCYSLSNAVDSSGALSYSPTCSATVWTGTSSVAANGSQGFSAPLSGLTSSTTYYYQFQVTFASGSPATAYGSVQNFTTLSVITFHKNPPSFTGLSDAPASQSIAGSATLNANPFTIPGLTFGNWNTLADGTGTAYADRATLATTMDVDLYAQWTANNYKIGFDAGGGMWASSQPATVTARYGSSITTPGPTVATRTGYNFAGWAYSSVTYGANSSYPVPAFDTVLVATWSPQTYRIQYNLGTATGTVPGNQYFVVGGPGVTVASRGDIMPPVSKSGWTFGGWTETLDGNSAVSTPYTPAASVTLYPVWVAPGSIAITYHSNYPTGSNSTAQQTGSIGTFTVRDATAFTYAGWVIDHWVDANNASVTYTLGQVASFSANTDLNAVWRQLSYTLHYAIGSGTWSGSAPADASLHLGDTVTVSVAPTPPSGYSFTGWNDGSAGYQPGATYSMPAASTTLTAQYLINSYFVTFDSRGGSWLSGNPSGLQSYGAVIALPTSADVRRVGYQLLGWTILGVNYNQGDPFTVGSSGVSIQARWSGNTYTVIYDANGGSFATPPTDSSYQVGVSSAINLPVQSSLGTITAPTPGFIFGGWAIDAGGLGPVSSPYTPSDDIRLYAIWTPPSNVSITYNTNYPTASGLNNTYVTDTPAPGNVTISHSFTAPVGYVLDHWVENTTSATYSSGAIYRGYVALNLSAVWSKIPYQLTYNPGSGAWVSGAPSALTLNYNDAVSTQARTAVGKTGYRFIGWQYTVGGTTSTVQDATTFTMPASDVTLTAQFAINTYNVNFSLGSGTWSITDPSGSATYGTTINLPDGSSSVRTGYSLTGWSIGGAPYALGGTYVLGAANTTITAVWTPNVYTVTFDMNNGDPSESPRDQSYTVGTTGLSLDIRDFTIPVGYSVGYTFGGWAYSSGSSSAVSSGNFIPTQDTRLFAIWVAPGSYTIQYKSSYPVSTGLADSTASQLVDSGAGTIALTGSFAAPTGWVFDHWVNEKDSTVTYALTGPYSAGAGATLDAVWTQLSYSLGYDPGTGSWSGSAPASQSLHYLDQVSTESRSVVSKPGYTFIGWFYSNNGGTSSVMDSATFEMHDHNVTLTARYEINSYVVTFLPNSGSWNISDPSGSQLFGSTISLPQTADIRRTGYTFGGWTVGGASQLSGGQSFALGAADVTVQARWVPDTYTVSFRMNGGSASSAPADAGFTFGSGSPVHLPVASELGTLVAPTAGYVFMGWSETSGGTSPLVGSYTPTANTALYAIWGAPATISVRYQTNYPVGSGLTPDVYSTTPMPGSVHLNHVFSAPTGYHFVRWVDAGSATTYSFDSVYSAFTDLTLNAVWEINNYSLGYDSGSGSWTGSAPAVQQLHLGDSVTTAVRTLLTNPGYTFVEWTYNSGANSIADNAAFSMPASPVTLTARYSVNSYNVGFSTNGGGFVGSDPSGSHTYGSFVQLPGASAITRAGFTFLGWSVSGTNYSGGDYYSVPASDSTLTARWQDATAPVLPNHTVTLLSNYPAGSGRTDSTYNQANNSSGALASPFSTPAGYAFVGWATRLTGSPIYSDGASYDFAADLTLYAIWKNLGHVLTLHGNLPTGDPTVTQLGTSPASILANPWSLSGFTFAGWNTQANGSGTSYAAGASFAFNTEASLYAQWTKDAVVPPVTQETRPTALPEIVPIPITQVPLPNAIPVLTAGNTETARLESNPSESSVAVAQTGWSVNFVATDIVGTPAPLNSQGQLLVQSGLFAHATGTGYLPNAEVRVYVLGQTQLLGMTITDAKGAFDITVKVPTNLEAGVHILQLSGYTVSRTIRTVSIPAIFQSLVGKVASAKVYFAPGKALLTATTKAALKAFAKQIGKNYKNLQVGSVGFVYPYDTKLANLKLSLQRAKNVNIYLKKTLGLVAVFVSRGAGRSLPASSNSRRVEVYANYASMIGNN